MPGLSIYLHSFEYNGHKYKWNNTTKKYYNNFTKLEFSGPPVNAYSCIYSRQDPAKDTNYNYKRKYYQKTAYAENHKQRWTIKEINMILAHEEPDTTIATKIGRSVEAIQVARCRFKKGLNNDSK